MSEGIWAVLGAVVGSSASILTTWLTLRGRTDYYDDRVMSLFRRRIAESDNKEAFWKDLKNTGEAIGLKDDLEIRQLLFLSGAEPVKSDTQKWKLVDKRHIFFFRSNLRSKTTE